MTSDTDPEDLYNELVNEHGEFVNETTVSLEQVPWSTSCYWASNCHLTTTLLLLLQVIKLMRTLVANAATAEEEPNSPKRVRLHNGTSEPGFVVWVTTHVPAYCPQTSATDGLGSPSSNRLESTDSLGELMYHDDKNNCSIRCPHTQLAGCVSPFAAPGQQVSRLVG